MIDWDLAPEGATHAVVKFRDDDEWELKVVEIDRPTQKTVADAVEGEKWTHTIDGLKVRFLVDCPDEAGEVPVVADDGYYRIFDVDQLKPIKPTLSESEAWRMAVLTGNMQHITDNYDVVKD